MQSELPVWVWDMLIELEDQRDTHPELLFQAGGMAEPERYEWCLYDDLQATLTWPAHSVCGRDLTEADDIEAKRLANEHWRIEIRPRTADDERLNA